MHKTVGNNNCKLHFYIVLFFFFFFLSQIECSSISEYSEKIIKANHLDSGKQIRCVSKL